ncbi:MAG: sporulation protein YunB [Sporolactobacillus sp.]
MFKPDRRLSRRTMPFKRVFLITVLLFSVFTAIGLWIINAEMKPAVLAIALTQAEQLGNYSINYGQGETVLTNVTDKNDPNPFPTINMNQLIVTHMNNNKEVTDYSLNPQAVNHVKGIISDRILWFLRAAEKGQIALTNSPDEDLTFHQHGNDQGIVADIPLGQVLNNALLSNYGPTIPVEMDVVSNVQTDLRWSYKNVGINTVIFMIYLDVKVKVDVIVPFAMQSETISQHLLLGSKILPLNVPYYYSSGSGSQSPSVTLDSPKKNGQSK